MIVSATGLAMEELGVPWCPVLPNQYVSFNSINKLLKMADGPGCCFQLSKKSLEGLTVRDVFTLETGECFLLFLLTYLLCNMFALLF